MRELLHKSYCSKEKDLVDWYCEKTKGLGTPIYSSYDIRDSGFKVSNVDGNIYPAGFNNICPVDRESSIEIMRDYLQDHYGQLSRVMLVTEEHTQNPYYWDNVHAIKTLLTEAGCKVLIAFPRKLESPLQLKSASGHNVEVVSGEMSGLAVKEFKPELIISNNDFSNEYADWGRQVSIPINPPRELGWYQRKKSAYFQHYNDLVQEFSKVVGVDPFLLNVKTELFVDFELADETKMSQLADRVDHMIESLRTEYSQRGIEQSPVLFVKNNAGTYGLGVMRVTSGAEIKEMTYKARKKMKAAKGGRDVSEVILQEGIPSRVQSEGASAEPVIYMIGCQLAGGFLRTHPEKSSTESLNSPGAVYKKLCVSDLEVGLEGNPLENVYGWSARLGVLAIGREANQMKVEFKGYKPTDCRNSE